MRKTTRSLDNGLVAITSSFSSPHPPKILCLPEPGQVVQVATRPGVITSLEIHNDRLYDAGMYGCEWEERPCICDTLTDEPITLPSPSHDGIVKTLCSHSDGNFYAGMDTRSNGRDVGHLFDVLAGRTVCILKGEDITALLSIGERLLSASTYGITDVFEQRLILDSGIREDADDFLDRTPKSMIIHNNQLHYVSSEMVGRVDDITKTSKTATQICRRPICTMSSLASYEGELYLATRDGVMTPTGDGVSARVVSQASTPPWPSFFIHHNSRLYNSTSSHTVIDTFADPFGRNPLWAIPSGVPRISVPSNLFSNLLSKKDAHEVRWEKGKGYVPV